MMSFEMNEAVVNVDPHQIEDDEDPEFEVIPTQK